MNQEDKGMLIWAFCAISSIWIIVKWQGYIPVWQFIMSIIIAPIAFVLSILIYTPTSGENILENILNILDKKLFEKKKSGEEYDR